MKLIHLLLSGTGQELTEPDQIRGWVMEFYYSFYSRTSIIGKLVSLLCLLNKIMSKTLANKLREAMEQVPYQDQTYCVPDRSMVDNI